MESKQKIKDRKKKEAEAKEAASKAEEEKQRAIELRRVRLLEDIKVKRAKMVVKLASLTKLIGRDGDAADGLDDPADFGPIGVADLSTIASAAATTGTGVNNGAVVSNAAN